MLSQVGRSLTCIGADKEAGCLRVDNGYICLCFNKFHRFGEWHRRERVFRGLPWVTSLENTRRRLENFLVALEALIELMLSSWLRRPALEWVRVSLRREKNFLEKIIRKKVLEKCIEKVTEKKWRKKWQEKRTEKISEKMLSRGRKKSWKNVALWSVFLGKKSWNFGHFFASKSCQKILQNFCVCKILKMRKNRPHWTKNFSRSNAVYATEVWNFYKKGPVEPFFGPLVRLPPQS